MLEVGIPEQAMGRVPRRLAERNVFVGVRGATGLRVSPHLYTTEDDIQRLFDAHRRPRVTAPAGRRPDDEFWLAARSSSWEPELEAERMHP
jgi:hypothetical protein